MKMLLILLLLGVLVIVVVRSMRNERSAFSRRRYDGTDSSYMGGFGTEDSHHGHGHDGGGIDSGGGSSD